MWTTSVQWRLCSAFSSNFPFCSLLLNVHKCWQMLLVFYLERFKTVFYDKCELLFSFPSSLWLRELDNNHTLQQLLQESVVKVMSRQFTYIHDFILSRVSRLASKLIAAKIVQIKWNRSCSVKGENRRIQKNCFRERKPTQIWRRSGLGHVGRKRIVSPLDQTFFYVINSNNMSIYIARFLIKVSFNSSFLFLFVIGEKLHQVHARLPEETIQGIFSQCKPTR